MDIGRRVLDTTDVYQWTTDGDSDDKDVIDGVDHSHPIHGQWY